MNFSKGFLLTFQLLAIIFQIILIGSIPNVNMTHYYIFAVSTIITYFFTTYTTYQIKFHSGDEKSESDDE
jgi:uncharacterized membrane-anchored protein YitT (DUF2179 family)